MPAAAELADKNSTMHASESTASGSSSAQWASKYRGATVEDLDPPSALSCNPSDPISYALLTAFERDYTHLTVVSQDTRALIGYISTHKIRELLEQGKVSEEDPISKAMIRFQKRGARYRVISPQTPLEELEGFFRGVDGAGAQEFAVVTDETRRFVLGVATLEDLEKFAKTRPS